MAPSVAAGGPGASGPVRSARELDDGRPVVRPSIPFLIWVAAGLVLGVLVGERLAWQGMAGVSEPSRIYPVVFAIVAGLLVGLAVSRVLGRMCVVAAIAGAVAAGTLLAIAQCSAWEAGCAVLAREARTDWLVEAVSDPAQGQFGTTSRVRVAEPSLPARARGIDLVAYWPGGATPPETGTLVRVRGTVAVPAANGDPRARERMRDGVSGTLRVRRIESANRSSTLRGAVRPLRTWATGCTHGVAGSGGALLDGIVLGDRRRLAGTEAEADFKVTGLTHLVAVSGSHLVVVAACVAVLAGALGTRRRMSAALIAVSTGLYVLFSGVQVSAVRAWVMAVVVTVASLSGRRSDALGALAATATLMVIASPLCVFDLGFELSVLSVLALLLLARLAGAWFSTALPGRLRVAGAAVSVTLVAQLGTLPVTTQTFGQLSLVAPVANALVGPLVSVALLTGLAGLLVSWPAPAAGALVLRLTGSLLGLGARIAAGLAAMPNAAVPATEAVITAAFAAAFGGVLLWACWPQPRSPARARMALTLCALVVIAVALGPLPPSGAALTVLDVGQGDAILIRDAGAAVLVDTGPSPSAMRAALARTGVRRLEAVIFTHAHSDHTGGRDALAEVTDTRSAFAGPAETESLASAQGGDARRGARGTTVRDLAAGDVLVLGGWRLEVLWPRTSGRSPESANARSVVVLARYGTFEALLTGDAEREVLDQIASAGALEDVDVLKVGHHGSKVALETDLLEIMRPEVAVISVGAANRFGHPAPNTLGLLASAGARTLRTDARGDVTFRIRGDAYTLDTDR